MGTKKKVSTKSTPLDFNCPQSGVEDTKLSYENTKHICMQSTKSIS